MFHSSWCQQKILGAGVKNYFWGILFANFIFGRGRQLKKIVCVFLFYVKQHLVEGINIGTVHASPILTAAPRNTPHSLQIPPGAEHHPPRTQLWCAACNDVQVVRWSSEPSLSADGLQCRWPSVWMLRGSHRPWRVPHPQGPWGRVAAKGTEELRARAPSIGCGRVPGECPTHYKSHITHATLTSPHAPLYPAAPLGKLRKSPQ